MVKSDPSGLRLLSFSASVSPFKYCGNDSAITSVPQRLSLVKAWWPAQVLLGINSPSPAADRLGSKPIRALMPPG